MKRFFLLVLAVPVMLVSCSKKSDSGCQSQDPAKEVPAITAFAQVNDIGLIKDTSGIYYHVVSVGEGPAVVSPYDTVLISYVGKTLDNQTFDTGDSILAYAGTFIPGFQWGLTKGHGGGEVEIVMPSYMAYGCTGSRDQNGNLVIQPNQPLYFDVKLLSVKPYHQ